MTDLRRGFTGLTATVQTVPEQNLFSGSDALKALVVGDSVSYEIEANYSEQWLLPPSLEDLLAAGHPARLVQEFVDAVDLKG